MSIEKNEYKGWFFDFLLFFLFYGVQYFAELPATKELFAYSRIVITFILFFIYIKDKYYLFIPVSVTIMCLCLFINTYFNGDDLMLPITRFYSIFGLLFLIAIRKDRYKQVLVSIFFSSEILIYINYFIMMLYPSGFGHDGYWIIGQKQDFVSVFFIATIVSVLLWKYDKYHLRIIFMFLVMLLSLSKALSLGLAISLSFFFFLLFLIRKHRIKNNSLRIYSYVFIGELFLLVSAYFINQYTGLVDLFSNINANDTVSKGDTLYERLIMWNGALNEISHNIFGVGYLTPDNFLKYIDWQAYPHVHNMMLDLMFTGGIFSLSAFIYLNIKVLKELNNVYTFERDVFVSAIISMNVAMFSECFYWPFAFALYMLAMIYIYNERNTMLD